MKHVQKDSLIIIMAKEPKPGLVKTRLTPSYTYHDAALIYEAMLVDTIRSLDWLRNEADIGITINSESNKVVYRQLGFQGDVFIQVPLSPFELAITTAFMKGFQDGYSYVFVIQSDGPPVPRGIIEQVLSLRSIYDLQVGPTLDGGFYLIGSNKFSDFFNIIDWSSTNIFEAVLYASKEKK